MSEYDDHVRWLSRQPKRALREIVERWGREHGRRWVIGGPGDWNHDELVSACARIKRGEQP